MPVAQHRKLIPQWVTPLKMAAQGATLTGVVPSERLSRLLDIAISFDAPILVNLQFFCDESGYRVMSGEISTRVRMVCQRCLQEMGHDLSANTSWTIVADEDRVPSLPKQYEPWIVSDSEADLYALIEEELLLELPLVAYHSLNQCEGKKSFSTGEIEEPERPNPFDVLLSLKLDK